MYENFLKLDEEKRNRIENAAFEVFAKNDYKRASTLEIIEKAQISKGALFHYFGNKRNLYFHLFDIGINLIMKEINSDELKKNPDFFQRIEESTRSKMKAMKKHPFVYSFFVKIYIEEDESVRPEIITRLSSLVGNQSILFENIDMYKFRKPVNIELLSNMVVSFAMEFIQSRLIVNEYADQERLATEFQMYIDMLKDNFYKEEYI